MSEFYPISPLVPIKNTSYAAQAGVMNDMWAARVVRGRKILVEKTISDLTLDNFVGVIYGHARLPGLSRYEVAQCAGRLMQFARRYQQSGICPNFEVPGLVREDGTTTGSGAAETSSEQAIDIPAGNATSSSQRDLVARPLGAVPKVYATDNVRKQESLIEVLAAAIQEITAYGSNLPKGHLEAMISRIAEATVRRWSAYEDPKMPIQLFVDMIMSCTNEGQIPTTADNTLVIESGKCQLLIDGKWYVDAGTKAPPKFPCAFHEAIAEKVSEVTSLKIRINTSSTGCIITISVD